MRLKASLAVCSVALLAACGGGGGGVSTTLPAYNYTEGSPSSETNADQAITSSATYALPYIAPNGATYSSLSAANTALNSGGDAVATRDTNARAAWQQGWTGRGVKIGVADGFNSNGVIDAHGDWVVVVASSVAPEATFAMRDVLSSATLVAQLGDINEAYTYFEQNGYHIINNSWGVERPERNSSGAYTGTLYSDFDSLVNATVAAFDPNSPSSAQGLYILAGGNGAEHCPTRRIENCNWMAAVLDQIRDAGYAGGVRTIFVGSLADNSENLAVYSYYAGDLKNDFIVAHDDVFTAGDAGGTSFAAPRVAGAAALVEHKFPNLSSAQIKQVLLQSADDLGAPGVDEVYGHGRLNILNALSPQGSVVPR